MLIAQIGEHIAAGHGAPALSRGEFPGAVRDVEVDDNQARGSAGDTNVVCGQAPPDAYASRIDSRLYTVSDQRQPVPLPEWIAPLLVSEPAPSAPAGAISGRFGVQSTAYATAALREETRLVATSRPGTRNDTLNRAAFSLGQLVAAGLLPPLAVATALAGAAERAGLPADETGRTIRSGMTAGSHCPRNGLTRVTRPATQSDTTGDAEHETDFC